MSDTIMNNISVRVNNEGAWVLSAFVRDGDTGDVWLDSCSYYFYEDETIDQLKVQYAERIFCNGWTFAYDDSE